MIIIQNFNSPLDIRLQVERNQKEVKEETEYRHFFISWKINFLVFEKL